MLRCTDEHFLQFGEIYFSSVQPGVIKGWHMHREMTLNYACINGNAKIVIYDDREGSKTRGELQEVYFGLDNYCLVQVPHDTWNGFTAVGGRLLCIGSAVIWVLIGGVWGAHRSPLRPGEHEPEVVVEV